MSTQPRNNTVGNSDSDGRDSNVAHSREWGYFPSGILGTVLLILLILMLLGQIWYLHLSA